MQEPWWLAQAKALPFMGRRKIQCCGDSASLLIQHTAKGFSAYCFRDPSHGGFVPHGGLSLKDLAARKRALEELQNTAVSLPKDFTSDIPPHAMGWLLRAGVGFNLASAYSFGYSETLDRVILPVYDGEELVAVITRAIGNERPKYTGKFRAGNELFYSDNRYMLPGRTDCTGTLVIVEDILSAVRVGRIYPTIALLGTTVSGRESKIIERARNSRIAVWLDGDRAGQSATKKIRRSLELAGASVTQIDTPRDPKRYSNRQIRELLC